MKPCIKLATCAAVFLGASYQPSVADVIKCTFTEPFVDTIYSTTQSSLTIDSGSGAQPIVLNNISLQIMAPNVFELWDADKRPVQRLKLNFEGSNGMDDTKYPYDVYWLTRGLRGGCTSIHLKRSESPK